MLHPLKNHRAMQQIVISTHLSKAPELVRGTQKKGHQDDRQHGPKALAVGDVETYAHILVPCDSIRVEKQQGIRWVHLKSTSQRAVKNPDTHTYRDQQDI